MCRMRHPHLVSFLGLCTLPPSILTGGPIGRAGRRKRDRRQQHRGLKAAVRDMAGPNSLSASLALVLVPRVLPARQPL